MLITICQNDGRFSKYSVIITGFKKKKKKFITGNIQLMQPRSVAEGSLGYICKNDDVYVILVYN